MNKFKINTDFITLGQFLKATDQIGSGGEAKFFLFENEVYVNGEKRTERGKKLFHGDKVVVKKTEYFIIYDSKNNT